MPVQIIFKFAKSFLASSSKIGLIFCALDEESSQDFTKGFTMQQTFHTGNAGFIIPIQT